MSIDSNAELRSFHQFLGEALASGEAALTPEEAIDQWRAAHPSPDELADDLAAVQEALEDMARGDKGIPLDEFKRQFRQRHGLGAES